MRSGMKVEGKKKGEFGRLCMLSVVEGERRSGSAQPEKLRAGGGLALLGPH
jgi:hypothetical protein